jgi:DNA-binding CsgD family transcriptional regulator
MRSSKFGPFSEIEFRDLKQTTPLVLALVAKHWAAEYELRKIVAKRSDHETLDAAFSSFKTEVLSQREQHIVSLVLRGHSSASVANVLGIAEGTVKNHRKHIHAKLGIASQGELFNQFLTHILNLN